MGYYYITMKYTIFKFRTIMQPAVYIIVIIMAVCGPWDLCPGQTIRLIC